jgi:hypothetical protein
MRLEPGILTRRFTHERVQVRAEFGTRTCESLYPLGQDAHRVELRSITVRKPVIRAARLRLAMRR